MISPWQSGSPAASGSLWPYIAGPKIPDGADFAASGSGNDCHSVAAIDIFLERNRAFIISERSRSEIGFVVRLTDFGLHYVVLGNILRERDSTTVFESEEVFADIVCPSSSVAVPASRTRW